MKVKKKLQDQKVFVSLLCNFWIFRGICIIEISAVKKSEPEGSLFLDKCFFYRIRVTSPFSS